MKKMSFGGRSLDTYCHSIDINNMNISSESFKNVVE
jgi:hypothetical protein